MVVQYDGKKWLMQVLKVNQAGAKGLNNTSLRYCMCTKVFKNANILSFSL